MKQKHIDLYSQTNQKPTEDIQQLTQKQPVNYETLKLQVRLNNQPQDPQGRKTNTPRASAAPHLYNTINILINAYIYLHDIAVFIISL